MSKRMIIFENCEDCPNSCMRFLIPEDRICSKMFTKQGERVCPEEGTPDWCPLPELPEEADEKPYNNAPDDSFIANSFEAGFAKGWNKCLDVITGEKEE